MVKKQQPKKKSIKKSVRKMDNPFLIILTFLFVLEILLILPVTSNIIQKVPSLYLVIFYFLIFLFPLGALLYYYFAIILKAKTECGTAILFSSLLKGLVSFIIFIAFLYIITLETRELAVIILSEVYIKFALWIGLGLLIFSVLLKIYFCKFKKNKSCLNKNGK